MLFDPSDVKEKTLPHKEDYDACQARLSETERQLLREIFEKLIDSRKIHSSVALDALTLEEDADLKALLTKAADGKKGEVGRLCGLYLYNAFIEHKDKWIFKASEGRLDHGGYIYWREGYKSPKQVN